MKKYFLIIIVLSLSKMSLACSCSPFKIVNAFSYFEFIGIIEFETIEPVKEYDGFYKSKIRIKNLFKGNKKVELYINSEEGSSCGFIPYLNEKYFILAYRTSNGLLQTSYCLAYNPAVMKSLHFFKELKKRNVPELMSSNIKETIKKIDVKLFENSVRGIFLYKTILNSDLSVSKIIPINKNAKRNFNSKILNELKQKISYRKIIKEKSLKEKPLTSIIILNWSINYENEKVLTSTKI